MHPDAFYEATTVSAPKEVAPPAFGLEFAARYLVRLGIRFVRFSDLDLDSAWVTRRFVNHNMGVMGLGDLIDAAAAILVRTEKRLETISSNISNVSTPGFKRRIAISHADATTNHANAANSALIIGSDHSAGTLKQTGNMFDLAIAGSGHFLVRDENRFLLTRSGSFSRSEDGVLRDVNGMALQLAGGGDAVADGERIEVLGSGMIISDGAPLGAVGVFVAPSDDGTPSAAGLRFNGELVEADEEEFEIRQGMLESSNVVLSDEMIALMANVRQAEGAAQLARFYDQLLGQATTTFARGGR